jgi:hypothetical protein
MVKRLLILSLLVLAVCGAGTMSFAGGPAPVAAGSEIMPAPPCPPPVCGPVQSKYSVVREQITPVPAQLRRVRVAAPYLAGVAWPRTPLAFFGNAQTYPNPIAPGRYEWLVPVGDLKSDAYKDRCVYVKANYIKQKPFCGPVPMAPPPPMPARVVK